MTSNQSRKYIIAHVKKKTPIVSEMICAPLLRINQLCVRFSFTTRRENRSIKPKPEKPAAPHGLFASATEMTSAMFSKRYRLGKKYTCLQQGPGNALSRLWHHRWVRENAVQDVLPNELSRLARQPEWGSARIQLVHEAPVLPEIHRRAIG